ncbi:apolipoprotein N-acyltransferase [Magnetovibrio sp.]|uniref:apolipoprotein N-acyltransferase n=1 Tax=Magnetovibrio sp. TaxID=2024836 RepID=UPI002F934CAC
MHAAIALRLAWLRAWMGALSVWQARLLAFVLGAVAVFAMPPTYQIYLLIPAFSALLWLSADAPSRWRAFMVGWWFGAGFFAAGLYWISFALLVEADKFAWLIPFAIFGFAFGIGLFCAVAALVVHMAPGRLTARALVLAGAWALLEWVRAWLFTGLPWNPVGSVWAVSDAALQGAAVAGVFGLSLLTVLAAASVGAVADDAPQLRRGPRWLSGLAFLGLIAMWGWGDQRLADAPDATVPDVRLRLVQPNIAQVDKWKPELREVNMMAQIELAIAAPRDGEPQPTHVIWAETSAPFFLENHGAWRRLVGGATPPGGLTILGAPRALPPAAPGQSLRVANAMLAVDESGRIDATFDKFHLVPFGEYVPFSDWLPLDKITQGQGAFTPGPGPTTLRLKGLPPVSPLICYEIIFPHQVTDSADRPRWLLNLTNDAWYGKTAGPHQHFVSARMRAVEEGLPTVRVAFTGISGIIDGYGRVVKELSLGEKGFVDGDLPQAVDAPGLYARFGNLVPVVLSVLTLGFGLGFGWRERNFRAD